MFHTISTECLPLALPAGPDGDQDTTGAVEERRAPVPATASGDAEREAAGRVVHRHLGPLLEDREIHRDNGPSNGNRRRRRRRGESGGLVHINYQETQKQESGESGEGDFLGGKVRPGGCVVSVEVGRKKPRGRRDQKVDESELVCSMIVDRR